MSELLPLATLPADVIAALDEAGRAGMVVDHLVMADPGNVDADELHLRACATFFHHLQAPRSSFDLARARSRAIDDTEFLGPFWDRVGHRVLWPGSARTISGLDGYAYALALPPYGLRPATQEDVDTICARLVTGLFAGLRDADIRAWSKDWSDYFDQGLEWWGAYLWTVRVPQRSWIVAAGASTTD